MATAVLESAQKSVEQAPPAPKSVAQPFDDIMRRYSGMVYNRCLHITKNAADAEDATQAVFLTLSMHLQSSKQIKYIGPWLEQVAKRVSLNLIRSRKRRTRRENVVAEMRPPETIDTAQPDLDEVRALIREEVNNLPTKYRLPLILHYFGETSTEEIARELGCTTNALCVRLHRGREMLRKRLAERGVVMSVTGLGLAVAQIIRNAVSDELARSLLYTATTVTSGGANVTHLVGSHVATLAQGAMRPVIGTKLAALGAFITLALGMGTWSGADRIQDVVQSVRQVNVPTMNPGETLRELFRSAVPRLSDASQQQNNQPSNPSASPLPRTVLALSQPNTAQGAGSAGGAGGGSVGQVPLVRHGQSILPSGPLALSSPKTNTAGTGGYLPLPPEAGSRVLSNQASHFRAPERDRDLQAVAMVDFDPDPWGTGPGGTDLVPGEPGDPGAPGFSLGIPLSEGTGTYVWTDPARADEEGAPFIQFLLTDVVDPAPMLIDPIAPEDYGILDLPAGHRFANVWSMNTTASFNSAEFVIHYDDAHIHELGLDETKLKLWVFDGEWKRIDDGLDITQDLIWGEFPGSGFAYVAISTPEPGAILSLGLGAGYFLMRRRRTR